MATLLSRTVASSYQELLKINGSGLTSSASVVEDGSGVACPLFLGTTQVIVSNTATSGFLVAAPTTISAATSITGALTVSGGLVLSGGTTISGALSATALTLTATTGTAPLVVASQTLVSNLNSQYHNGKTAPSGDIVGSSDTQTLTNKTISGASNTFSAIPNTSITGLGTLSTQNANSVSITGGSVAGSTISGTIGGSTIISTTGNVSGGQASFSRFQVSGSNRTMIFPLADGTNGQALITDGAGNLAFGAISGGGGGGGLASVSADTAPTLGGNLNVSTYSIISTSNRNISITPDGTGTTIITKVATPSAGTDAVNKTYVDNHTTRTDNPHSVTATQVGRDTAQWNANKIQGRTVSSTTPTNGQVLTYNTSTTQYEPTTPTTVPSGFWGFKLTDGATTTSTHLSVDYGTGSFTKSNYRDFIFGPFTNFSVDASGHLVATF
jgi:hypothetical protein